MVYVVQHAYADKDDLPNGDADKIILGKDLQDDFDAIARELRAVDSESVADQADLDKEIKARQDGDSHLQSQINSLGTGSDYDDTQIKADLSAETQARVNADNALDLRIDAVEDSITDNGGFVDAPNDGKIYGRQSEDWSEISGGGVSDWADIENKPTEFPPSAHTHEIAEVNGLQDALDNAGGVSGIFISDTAPASPEDGMMWLDSTTAIVWIWDEDKWLEFPSGAGSESSSVAVGDAPDNPSEGDQWLNTNDGYLYIYYDNSGSPTWMAVGGTA